MAVLTSLRSRLLLVMALLSLTVLALAGIWSSRVAHSEIRRLTIARGADDPPAAQVAEALRPLLVAGGDRTQLGSTLDRLGGGAKDFVLLGADRRVIARSPALDGAEIHVGPELSLDLDRQASGLRMRARLNGPHTTVEGADGQPLAWLYWLARDTPGEEMTSPVAEATARADRALLAAFFVSALAALALAWATASRLAGPVERLIGAVRRVESGDLGARVDIDSHDEIGALARAFNDMAEARQRQDALRRRLVGDVAHELRTPLTHVIGQLEAMQDGLVPLTRAALDALHEDATHLAAIVHDLQELAVAESAGWRLDLQAVDLDLVCRQVTASLAAAAAERGITLRLESEPGGLVRGDEVRLAQVVRNLLDNALAHTPRDGRVLVRVTRGAAEHRIDVHDSGTGLPAEELANVFERFYRLDPARARATGGAGLGLAIVRELVEAHGGRVWAESGGPGQGATFIVVLPAAPAS